MFFFFLLYFPFSRLQYFPKLNIIIYFFNFLYFIYLVQLGQCCKQHFNLLKLVMKQACFAGCMQTIPNATTPIGQIHLFRKIPLEPTIWLWCPSTFWISLICATSSILWPGLLITESYSIYCLKWAMSKRLELVAWNFDRTGAFYTFKLTRI